MLFIYPARKLFIDVIVGPYFLISSIIPILNILPSGLIMCLIGVNLLI